MTLQSVSTRDRRVIQAGIGIILALFAAFRAGPAWWRWRTTAVDEATEVGSRAASERNALTIFPVAVDTLEARNARFASIGPLLAVATDSAKAIVAMSDFLADAARSATIRLDSVRASAASATTQRLKRLVIDARATGDINGLASLLNILERSPKLVVIRRVRVDPSNIDNPPDQPELLAIQLKLEGLALITGRAP